MISDHRPVGHDETPTTVAVASAPTIEDAVEVFLEVELGTSGPEWAYPIGIRFGIEGDRIPTLDEVGRFMGVTRERVRQVQARVSLPDRPLPCAAADAATDALDYLLPCSPADLADALAAAGITTQPAWHAAPLAAALSVTGRNLELVEIDGLVALPGTLVGRRAILTATRRLSERSGVTCLAEVNSRLEGERTPAGAHPTHAETNRVLATDPSVHQIGDGYVWTDHSPGRNRLVNASLKILAALPRQSITDMHGGVDRGFRWRASTGGERYEDLTAPDLERLTAFYRSHPAFTVESAGDEDSVTPSDATDLPELGADTQRLVEILRDAPDGVLSRPALITASQQAGLNTATVGLFLTFGECFKNYGHNVWGLRGLTVPEEVVRRCQDDARQVSRAEDRRQVSGTTPSGRPWMARVLTTSMAQTCVLPADWDPAPGTGSHLDAIDLTDGETVGRIRTSGPFQYGYNVLFRKHRVSRGDVLRVLADPADGICYLETGGAELLSEPFDL